MSNRKHQRAEQNRVYQWTQEKLARRLDRILARGLTPSAVIVGERIARALVYARDRGSAWAEHVLAVHAAQRIVSQAGDALRYRARVSAKVRVRGHWHEVEVPERYATRRRNAAGFPSDEATYPLWIELPWDELRAQVLQDEQVVAHDELKIAAKRKALALQAQYPQSACAKDACILAGVDWRQYLAQ